MGLTAFSFSHRLVRREWVLFIGMFIIGCLPVMLPAVAQAPHYHQFADQGLFLGIPHPFDVLSNMPFAIFGIWAWQLRQKMAFASGALRQSFTLFSLGLIATAFGSAYYHWAPDDVSLLWDRAGMALAFVGLLSLISTIHISERAAWFTATFSASYTVLALWVWFHHGNLLPWIIVQACGMCMIGFAVYVKSPISQPRIAWIGVLLCYALAKYFEWADHDIAQTFGGAMTGHSLKHMLASMAVWPVLQGVNRWQAPCSAPSNDNVAQGLWQTCLRNVASKH